MLGLLRGDRGARVFFLAHAQSCVGTGAGYVALLLLAYDRFASPWAIALVLLADFLPAMALGPVFGALADRWPRRRCLVIADAIRGAAFVGLAVVPGYPALVAFAAVAGIGSALFTPAVQAVLPDFGRERAPAATALYGALVDLGYTLGPAVAAVFLLALSPASLLALNGMTFALSAVALSRLPLGRRATAQEPEARLARRLRSEVREGLTTVARAPRLRVVVFASTVVVLFAGMVNVAELLLARRTLGLSDTAFSILLAGGGMGVVAGSLACARSTREGQVRQRFLAGLLLVTLGLGAAGLAPSFAVAVAAFFVLGLGNGFVLVNERLIIQNAVRDSVLGRVFGVKDALAGWGFAVAYAATGGLVAVVGIRPLFVLAGVGCLAVWSVATFSLRTAVSGADAVGRGAESPA